MNYPTLSKHWTCSDGRIFTDEKEAKEWQKILDKQERTTYAASPDDVPFEMRF